VVSHHFQGGGIESVGLVDDDQLDVLSQVSGSCLQFAGVDQMLVDARRYLDRQSGEIVSDLTRGAQDRVGVEDCPFPGQCGIDREIGVIAWSPFFEESLGFVSVRIPSGRQCFTDPGLAVADADGVLPAYGVGELDESAVLFGGDEPLRRHQSSSR
jgi:hypothetical protein